MSEHMNILRSLRPLLPYIEGKKEGRPDDRLLDTPEVFIDLNIINYEYTDLGKEPLGGWSPNLSVRTMYLDPKYLMAAIPEETLATIHTLKIHGYLWYGAAYWNIAAILYQAGLTASVSSNNVFAAIQIATDLASCYYAAKRYHDCFLVASNARPVAVAVSAILLPRLLTLLHLGLIGMEVPDLLNDSRRMVRKDPFEPDDRILEEASDIYTYLGDNAGVQAVQKHWNLLEDSRQH